MNFNIVSRIRRGLAKDLFIRTQNRLTLLYTGLLTLFLLLFIVVVYLLLHTVVSNQQKDDIRMLADQEANVIRDYWTQNKDRNHFEVDDPNLVITGNNQLFYYVLSPDGQLIGGAEIFGRQRPELLNMVQQWEPDRNEFQYGTLKVGGHGKEEDGRRIGPPDMQDIQFIMTARPIMIGKQLAGTLYVGNNISSNSKLFQWLLIILVGLAVIFSLAALWVGRFMSRRAMIPIVQSYTRQREFVADASHELRTPLSVLLSSINTLEMEEQGRDEFSGRLLSNMKDEVKRMAKLAGDLLLLARSDSGKLELAMETGDFRPHAEKTVQSMAALAASKQIFIQLRAPGKVMVCGDLGKLNQVLYILLDNAIKYTPENGEVRIELAVENAEKHPVLHMSVEDSGPGIAPEDYERIFDRFYRADKSRSRDQGGHGLGLAIAKWIVEAHKGRITVARGPAQGSLFTVTVPLQQAAASTQLHEKTQ